MVPLLLMVGLQLQAPDEMNLIQIALIDDNAKVARSLLKKHGQIALDEHGPLLSSAINGRYKNGKHGLRNGDMVHLLFEFGVNPNAAPAQGIPAFLYCLHSPYISVPALKVMLKKVNDVNIPMPDRSMSQPDEQDNALTLQMKWVRDAHIRYDVVECLLEAGMRPDVPSGWRPPILTTAYVGQLDVFKLLLKYKANPRVLNATGQSLLHIVTLRKTPGNLQISEYSLKNKLAPSDVLLQGETPYATAKRKGNKEAVKMFEKYGINK